jgi:hypothetical protein
MSSFLHGVLSAGQLMLREPLPAQTEADSLTLLADAYRVHALTVAGPALTFDQATALAAGRVLYQAAWYLLNGELRVEERTLRMPGDPATPAQHLSGDLLLRYLPAVHRRAQALRPDDALAGPLAEVLQRWPLSGVLADVAGGPLASPEFGGHRGLQMLYAERLAQHPKAAWFPTGEAMQAVELVWHALGKDMSVLSLAQQAAGVLHQAESKT